MIWNNEGLIHVGEGWIQFPQRLGLGRDLMESVGLRAARKLRVWICSIQKLPAVGEAVLGKGNNFGLVAIIRNLP